MKISENGLKLIRSFEGCRLEAYKCPAGVWTIGWGHTGNVKAGSFFTPSGISDFFGAGVLYKPQVITKEFVVAKNLKPGQSESFRVYFDYPPYFKNVAHFSTVKGR